MRNQKWLVFIALLALTTTAAAVESVAQEPARVVLKASSVGGIKPGQVVVVAAPTRPRTADRIVRIRAQEGKTSPADFEKLAKECHLPW